MDRNALDLAISTLRTLSLSTTDDGVAYRVFQMARELEDLYGIPAPAADAFDDDFKDEADDEGFDVALAGFVDQV